ncbi:MAG: nodulation protein NfeD [candidate division Zixibacteria bacterium]|nr:nodulation protein NfeD [candidate division Zixibacteria bacterium]MDH3937644.1 nodulation protein NfeD [candidate division Zixibacteria bacterium]MDH4034168.1 nodulation protein NfeD [candidate division Zixibacteria bacterium]
MKVRNTVLLIMALFLLVAPIISFSIRTAQATDSTGSDSALAEADTATTPPPSVPLVYTVVIEDAIGTVTDERIEAAIEEADENDADLLVIIMDTPGGFTKPTWSICKNILNSPVPVCTYIAPSGARAGSAGVYITYASHFAAMAPSTNIGAAHPVSGSGEEIDSVMNEKITNDAVAQIRAAAEKRGRNAEWAENAVRESVSITDNDALEKNVIDFRAEDLEDLLDQIDGQEAELPLGKKVVKVKNARTREIEMTFVHKFLKIITSPDIALILFSLGSLGIMLELYNPGSIFPGVVGAISLILAFYAFQTLPINYAGVALIILAIVLFIAEVKVISHGLLTIGGLISFFLGGLMLVDTVDPALQVSLSVLITVTILVTLVAGIAAWMVIRAYKRQPTTGNEGMIGKTAEVRKQGLVYVDGALWKARGQTDQQLEPGDTVEIVAVDKLTLIVKINS